MSEQEQELELEIEQEVETPEVELEVEPTEDQIAAREEAMKYGWRPKQDYTNNPEGWVDADRFLELPSTQMKVLRDENRAMKENFEERLERQNAASRQAVEAAQRIERDRAEERIREIRSQQRAAVEDGDVEKFEALEKQRENIQPQQAAPQIDPEVAEYREKNAWTKDPVMMQVAIQAIEDAPGIKAATTMDQIAYAERKVREYFPHKFEAPKAEAKPQRSRVDPGGLGGMTTTKGANSLPPEAISTGKDFVEQGLFKDLDAYAAAYFAQEGA